MSKQVFGSVWSTQVCDLYTDATEPSFNGHCTVPPTAQAQCSWCAEDADKEDVGVFTEVQVASMLAEVRPRFPACSNDACMWVGGGH
jgi:hypothetical protein